MGILPFLEMESLALIVKTFFMLNSAELEIYFAHKC